MTRLVIRLFAAIPRPWTPGTFAYVSRSVLAAGLALWLGFQLHLDSPFSGASTVLLLVQPVQGAVRGKGFYRMLGTLAGLFAACVLTGLFAQQMLLFLLGIGLWLGLCVAAMTVLRHYQATAAVVAGYTVCLALGPAIVAPQKAFEHIVTRGTAVAIGVLCLSLVVTLFSSRTMENKIRRTLAEVCARSARLLAMHLSGEQRAERFTQAHQLAIDIGKVDDLLGLGRGESALLRARQSAIQAGLAHLHAVVLDMHYDRCGMETEPPLLAQTSAALLALSNRLSDDDDDYQACAQTVRQLRVQVEACAEATPGVRQFCEQLADLSEALQHFSSLDHPRRQPVRVVSFHRNYADAARNGCRALLALLAAGAIWYLSGWDQGPTLLAVVGPCCTLLATAPAPKQGMAGFIRGTFYAVVAAALCKFLLLPQINDFPLLLLMLAAFWSFGIHATSQPRHALQGVAYLIGFNTLVSTGSTAIYDFADFANQSLAWFVAMAVCLLAFQMMPRDRVRDVQALKRSIQRGIRSLLRRADTINHPQWQAKQQHRIVTLKNLLGTDIKLDDRAGWLSLQLSKQLNRIQQCTDEIDPDSDVAHCARASIRRMARCSGEPGITAVQARRTAKAMSRLGAEHLAIVYKELAWLLEQYAIIASPVTRKKQPANLRSNMT
ncbi:MULTISPECIES: FUSC family protein [unclassified Pseudomonas]|uniref:FUSC family protein n=1 Tax=unclassified Pseudomonas TaxID=196821 RepID=UPI000A1EA956|nr:MULTISPECIES: FUSC family protein [unclassified Pseudomonas]